MAQRLSPEAVIALRNALASVYWFKKDLRHFIYACVRDATVLGGIDFNQPKVYVADDLVDALTQSDRHLETLTRLCVEVANFRDFSHLERLDDGADLARQAREAVATLKKLVEPHEQAKKDQAKSDARQESEKERLARVTAFREQVQRLRERYFALAASMDDPQQRGRDLESLMRDLFRLHDLDPRASFNLSGEQIDGAFYLHNTDYLFEAKWEKGPIGRGELDIFASKVRRKLENTLGLFLSIGGFTSDAIKVHSHQEGTPILLMDGQDLMLVLEERIEFEELLIRKKRHAAQTGEIYLPAQRILAG